MKKLFLSLIAMMIAVAGFAQSTLVATLSHGDQISTYYGTYAFRDANAAAENGDIINLSGGSFRSTNITKAITVRGTGIADANPTYIIGAFDIEIPSDVTERLSFEGCRITQTITAKGTITNAYFLKNYIARINTAESDANLVNVMFADCQVYGLDLRGNSIIQCINSYVSDFDNLTGETASASFINCVIRPDEGAYGNRINSSMLLNCIMNYTGFIDYSTAHIPSTTSAVNCVAVGDGASIQYAFDVIEAKQNCSTSEGLGIFTDSDPLKDLTAEAKAQYIGSDNTPIGMYGGILPYDPTPSYPHITKMNVANKTTADGKLSVEIEVSAAE